MKHKGSPEFYAKAVRARYDLNVVNSDVRYSPSWRQQTAANAIDSLTEQYCREKYIWDMEKQRLEEEVMMLRLENQKVTGQAKGEMTSPAAG